LNVTQTAADFLIKSYNKSFITKAVYKREHERTSEPRIISLLRQILLHDGLCVILNTASAPVICFWKKYSSLGRL